MLDYKELSVQAKTDPATVIKKILDAEKEGGVINVFTSGGSSSLLKHYVLAKVWNESPDKATIKRRTGMEGGKLESMAYQVRKPQTVAMKALKEALEKVADLEINGPEKVKALEAQIEASDTEQESQVFKKSLDSLKKEIELAEQTKESLTKKLEIVESKTILKSFKGSRGRSASQPKTFEEQMSALDTLIGNLAAFGGNVSD